jgi:dolichyldiphosphatase
MVFTFISSSSGTMSDSKTALDWFYIEYPTGDTIGWLCAGFALMPFAVVIALVTLCVFRRDIHVMYIFVGQVINELMNSIFKQIFKRQRPIGSQRVDYGMPSDHAQFMGYIMTYTILLLVYHVRFCETAKRLATTASMTNPDRRDNGPSNAVAATSSRHQLSTPASLPFSENFVKGIAVCFVTAVSMVVLMSRVYLNYHNVKQVLVGVLLGCQIGFVWFLLYQFLLRQGWIDSICQWKLAQMFLIRNLAHIPNPLRYEYYIYQRGDIQKED